MNTYLLIAFVLALVIIACLVYKLYHINEQISFIKEVLVDIKSGNLNRRILVQENDITKQICYDINQIAKQLQEYYLSQARKIRKEK